MTELNVKQISLDSIKSTNKHNIRKIDEDGAKSLKQLSESIEAVGLLHPIIVRPLGLTGNYELLVGARRLGAVQVLDHKVIDAKIIEVDDQQAAIMVTTENLQREDLTPFEEAESLGLLLKENPDVKAVASNLGRSPNWVARRAKLLNLTPAWKKAADEEFIRWSAGHFELIARYDSETQDEFYGDDNFEGTFVEYCSVKQLEKILNEKMHFIKKTPWKPDDDSLIPEVGACTACPKRSSCQSLLFEPEDISENDIKANDKCLDVSCWDRKLKVHVDRQVIKHQKKHPNIVKINSDRCRNDDYEDVLNRYDYDNAKMKDTGAIPAVVVSGPGAGEKRWVIPRSSAPKSTTREKDEKDKLKPLSIDERLKKLQHRRNAWIVNKMRGLLEDLNFGYGFNKIILLATVFGTKYRNDIFGGSGDGWNTFDDLVKSIDTEGKLIQLLWNKISGVFISRLRFQTAAEATKRIPEVKRLCELTLFDFNKLVTQSESEIPVPKVLAVELAKQEKKKPEKADETAIAKKKPTANRTLKIVAVDLEIALRELETRSGDRFSGTAAFKEGNKIKIVYNQSPTLPDRFSLLTRLQAEQYLAWLDGVNIGTYEDMKMN